MRGVELSDRDALLHQIKLRKFKKGDPKKILYGIMKMMQVKLHYHARSNWDIMVELLARWIVENKKQHLELGSMGSCALFKGLPIRYDSVYKDINKQDLFECYYEAAQKKPWDHLGMIMTEENLGNKYLGQHLTPRNVIEMIVQMTLGDAKEIKQMKTVMDPCCGTGGFLLGATLQYPKAPLVLFGIDIGVSIYRACLVNMALFSNHPYSIMCADTLRLDVNKTGPSSKFWDLGNRWQPPDISAFQWKPSPIRKDAFSLDAFIKLKKT